VATIIDPVAAESRATAALPMAEAVQWIGAKKAPLEGGA
jgi:hypothetical protein